MGQAHLNTFLELFFGGMLGVSHMEGQTMSYPLCICTDDPEAHFSAEEIEGFWLLVLENWDVAGETLH